MNTPKHTNRHSSVLRRVSGALALAGTSAVCWVAVAHGTTGAVDHPPTITKFAPVNASTYAPDTGFPRFHLG